MVMPACPRTSRSRRLAAVVALLLAAWASPALALEFDVDSTSDGGDLFHGDGVCRSLHGRCTLRAAIQEANALGGIHTILLEAGDYEVEIPGVGEDAGATGDLDVTATIRIWGVGSEETSIVGTFAPGSSDRLFDVREGADLTLVDLRVFGGFVTGKGGGLRAGDDASVVLYRTRFERNFASEAGGGVALDSPSDPATLIVFESVFEENLASLPPLTGGSGGAIHSNFSSVTLLDSTLDGNYATDHGGALYSAGPLVIEGCTISHHTGVPDEPIASTIEILVGPARIDNSTLSGNTSEFATVLISGEGPLTIENSTIVNNEADVTLLHLPPRGRGVSVGNSVVFNARTPHECLRIESLGYNAFEAGSAPFCGAVPSDLTPADVKLGGLLDNGGATLTHRPDADSPLVDAGDDASCLFVDQRRVDRPQDGDGDGFAHCDIGAVELTPDSDGDGVRDVHDNCVEVPNPGQRDVDAGRDDDSSLAGVQHYGDACDADLDNDGLVGVIDFFAFFRPCLGVDPRWVPACVRADLDRDGIIGPADFFAVMRPAFHQPPGPGMTEF